MNKENIKVFEKFIDRMKKTIPDELKSHTNVEYGVSLKEEDNLNIDPYRFSLVIEPYTFSIESGKDDDRWIKFIFIETEEGNLYINQTMGSINGSSISAGSSYLIEPEDVDASINNFITLVFLPKMSSIFRDYTFIDNRELDKLLNDLVNVFFLNVSELTDGMDLFIEKTEDNDTPHSRMFFLKIVPKDGRKPREVLVKFEVFSNKSMMVYFADCFVGIDNFDDSSLLSLEEMIKKVINSYFKDNKDKEEDKEEEN